MGDDSRSKTKVLVAASAGGHWVQVRRLETVWRDCRVTYLTTSKGYTEEVNQETINNGEQFIRYFSVPDANINDRGGLFIQLVTVFLIMLRIRPDVVISTGASVGFFAVLCGKIMGCKTIWVDSIANTDRISLCGRKARPFIDLFLTQWRHLAQNEQESKGARYVGAVI